MLFKVKDLQGIKAGDISLAFRKWKKPVVKNGTLIKTAIGQIEVLSISQVNLENILDIDARDAGFKSRADLIKVLQSKSVGNIYKIEVAYHSPDPRIKLRAQNALSSEELDQIKLKLQRFDQHSKKGSWTINILQAIRDNPKLRAQDLASKTGTSKDWLKQNIRKLKNLGLTVSHEQGYTISPRGKRVLDKLVPNKPANASVPQNSNRTQPYD